MQVDENSNKYRRLKRALFGDPSGKIRTFAIISPENPLGFKDSTEEEFKKKFQEYTENKKLYNEKKLKELKGDMIAKRIRKTGDTAVQYGGFDFVQLKGSYAGREHSLMLFNLTIDDARSIAKDYGQESFFFAQVSKEPEVQPSTIAFYKTTNCCKSYKLIEMTRTVTDEEEAEDFFSKFGLKFKINLNCYGANISPIENNGMFEESFNRPTYMGRASARRSARQPIQEDTPYTLKEAFQDMSKLNKHN